MKQERTLGSFLVMGLVAPGCEEKPAATGAELHLAVELGGIQQIRVPLSSETQAVKDDTDRCGLVVGTDAVDYMAERQVGTIRHARAAGFPKSPSENVECALPWSMGVVSRLLFPLCLGSPLCTLTREPDGSTARN